MKEKEYQIKIGLEIHIQLKTSSKLFCDCPTDFGASANSQICPVCMGLPGVLPVFNKEAFDLAIKTALALNCKISEKMRFDRKHYFYPDMPKNFQISQYDFPLAKNGWLEISLDEKETKKIRIRRVHLEEDVGKLIHQKDISLIDYNRAGVPLMEIVTEPDISSPQQASKFLTELKTLLQYLGVSDCDMEKGQLRVDTNISVAKKGLDLKEKVEIKNLNSFKAVRDALFYEIERQKKIKKLVQETRLWDDNKKITIVMRRKEEAFDYRYFPEPDLPIFEIEKTKIELIKKKLPELPLQKKERFEREYGLDKKTIEILVSQKELSDFFEKIISEAKNWVGLKNFSQEKYLTLVKRSSNYLITDLLGLLAEKKEEFRNLKITPENFAELMILIEKGEISSRIAKDVLRIMFETGKDPSHIIEEKKLSMVSDQKEIEEIIRKVISENQKAVDDYKKGKETALEFLVGKVIAFSKGKIDPQKTRETLKKILDSSS